MKEGLLGGTLCVSPKSESKEARFQMLHAGLDLSRRKIDVCLISNDEIVDEWASPPDADGLRGLAARAAMWAPAVRGVIESMNGARFVHDRLEEHG
jgi:transposase